MVRILRSKASWSRIASLAAEDRLADHRHRLDHRGAEAGGVHRHVAPADQALALGGDEAFQAGGGEVARLGVLRQEAHRHRVAAGRRQGQALAFGPVAQQAVRHLDQAAGAVAHQRVCPDRAPVVEIDQDLQPLGDDVVRFPALDIGDEADATGVVLVPRIIEALLLGRSHTATLRAMARSGAWGRQAGVDGRRRATVVNTIGNAAVRPYQMPGPVP